MSQQTVTINGTVYDAHTGMPLEQLAGESSEVTPAPVHNPSQAQPSHSVHQITQKSQTLNRQTLNKNAPAVAPRSHPPTRKSPAITKFAPHPAGARSKARRMSDIGPVSHPMVVKANQHMPGTTRANLAPKPSHLIKQEAIAQALHDAPTKASTGDKQVRRSGRSRFFAVASSSLALLLLGGYFTYLNMPSLSVRVAAAQAGVDATYPAYRPDGYSLHGPVAYDRGEVSIKFAANAGPQNFSITQTKSNWDSSALEENYVAKASGGGFVPYIEHGLKIYVFDNNAAWVNGGVLYKITGDAPLSNDQLRRLATSM
jgi:hypothetical protein